MMSKINKLKMYFVAALAMSTALFSCKKDGNPNNLPAVNPNDYAGTIDGFKTSDDVFPENLVAYWSFDNTNNELKTASAPTTAINASFAATGIRGAALSLNAGYLYFARQFNAFKTDSLKSWSMSTWVKVLNNGSKRTMVFQMARPGIFNGNINFILRTNEYPASNTSKLRIAPVFATVGNGTQDNLNNVLDNADLTQWNHIVLTYDFNTGVFNNWLNGVKVGNFPNRGTGNSSFKSWEPSEVFIGSNYNAAGMPVNTDVAYATMTGQVDEMRIYNRALGDAFISALYKLGQAGK